VAQERTVVVGAGQLRRRPELDGPWEPIEPVELMARVAALAAEDAVGPEVLARADLVGTVDAIAWAYPDLAAVLAARLGGKPEQTIEALPGGNSPCQLLNEVASRIAEGQVRLGVLAGAETMHTRRRAAQEGVSLDHWNGHPPTLADFFKGQRPLTNDLERRHGLVLPIHCYPLYECALRARSGRSIDEHQRVVSEMMARFADVAARNPFAWFPERWTPEEIRTVSDKNRWVCFPYPKRMNAIMNVDMAAALIVMSTSEADRWGIPPERRVYYLGGAYAVDAWCPTERPDFYSSPAYRRASRAALGEAGVTLEEVDLFDFYSCFPCAVEMALGELGLALDESRPLTVTGGLSYAGGPGNNYSMHALANMVNALRRGEGEVGYVSALGMTATKHAVSILSRGEERAIRAGGRSSVEELTAEERTGPPLVDAPEGPGRIETYTVEFDRDNRPQRSILVVRLDDGSRTVANGEQTPPVFARLLEQEGVGARGRVDPGEGDAPNRFVLVE
jgi:acetyl-CoA C-acetyltransferase